MKFLVDAQLPRRFASWLISAGNISNAQLEEIVRINLDSVVAAFADHRFVELGRDTLLVHE